MTTLESTHAPLTASGTKVTPGSTSRPMTDTQRALKALSQRSDEIYNAINLICHFCDSSNERRSGYDRRTGRLIEADIDSARQK